MTTDELLAQLRADLPRDVVSARLTDHLDGYEMLRALADLFANVDADAVQYGLERCYFLTGDRGARAQTLVGISASPATDVMLKAGAVFRCADGRRFVSTSTPTWFGGVTAVKPAVVSAERTGAGSNVAANAITEMVSGVWIDPATGAVVAAPAGLAVAGSAAVLSTPTPAARGRFATLEMLARNRGVYAAKDETTETLRARAWPPPDTVIPAAMVRCATRVYWEAVPSPGLPPFDDVGYMDPMSPEAGFAYDDAHAWDDAVDPGGPMAFWVDPAPWFYLFVPDDLLGYVGGQAFDDDADFDDSTAYDDGYSPAPAVLQAVAFAIDQVKPAGVLYRIFVGSLPTP